LATDPRWRYRDGITPEDSRSHADSFAIRRYAVDYQVPYFTTMAGAEAATEGIELLKQNEFDVKALQDYESPRYPSDNSAL
jgi:carbamoyl-phosphate synthase large subunit